MRRHRTIYFNDARHYYLFAFDPPMRLEDAWCPIDEVAGTAVDTFIYGVERGDGLFYPSKVGLQFGADRQPFTEAYAWRAWNNMQSLQGRGLDPLSVLIDRSHEKGMDFFASLRMGAYGGMLPQHTLATGGRGYVHPEVRDHVFAVLKELATEYPVEGVELDFAAAPGGSAFCLRPEDVPHYTPVVTDLVRRVAGMVRGRPGGSLGQIGARIYPTLDLNLRAGLDVLTWLGEGLVDFVVPVVYAYMVLDSNMPIEWLVKAAHEREVSVFAMLQPYREDGSRRFYPAENASPAMMRAAAANFQELGVDGLYTWFLQWPFGDSERRTLRELGDPDLAREQDKHYFLRRRVAETQEHDCEAFLPLEIPSAALDRSYEIPFCIADDPGNDRVRRVVLRVAVSNLVSADRLTILLNGQPLSRQACRRLPIRAIDPYAGQWLEFELVAVRPRRGANLLNISLDERPAGFAGGVTIEDVEILVKYGTYPTTPQQT